MAELTTTMRDPLVLALALLTFCLVASRFLFRSNSLGRAAVRLLCFVLLTAVLLERAIVPYRPAPLTGPPVQRVVGVILEAAWWLWAAWLVVGILRWVLVFETRPRESKLLQDVLAGIAYLAALFAIIAYVFDLPIQGLIATSGAIAIILGLALQSSLGDVFSGLVLSLSRPYRPDDWIRLDNDTEGQVVELIWRATHILTAGHDLAIVPNSMIARMKVVNVTAPSGLHGITLEVRLDPGVAPAAAMQVLRNALLNARRVLSHPEPAILVRSMSADAIAYRVTFFVADLDAAAVTQNECFDLMHRHLGAAGIALASDLRAPPPSTPIGEAERALAQVSLLAGLTPTERAALAGRLRRRTCEPNEVVLEPGTVLQSLFVIGGGVLSVRREGAAPVEVLRLGPGDHYGEIGMLTGTPSIARIVALTPGVIFELPKGDLAPLLEARPEVAHELGRELALRQAAGRLAPLAAAADPLSARRLSDWFAERMRKLLEPDPR